MIWILYFAVTLTVLVGLGWLWSRIERAVFPQTRPVRRVSPVSPPPAAPRGGYEAAERLDLPSGPEGHLAFAVELERVAGAYRAHTAAEVRRGR